MNKLKTFLTFSLLLFCSLMWGQNNSHGNSGSTESNGTADGVLFVNELSLLTNDTLQLKATLSTGEEKLAKIKLDLSTADLDSIKKVVYVDSTLNIINVNDDTLKAVLPFASLLDANDVVRFADTTSLISTKFDIINMIEFSDTTLLIATKNDIALVEQTIIDSTNVIKLLLVKDFNQVGNDHILTLENGTTFSVPDSIGIDSAGVRAILSDSLALYVAKSDSITLFVTLNQFNDSLVTKDVLLIDNMSIDSTFDITQGGNLVGTIDLSAYLKSNHVVSRYIDDVGNIVENDSIIFNTPSSLINFEFVENVLQLKLLNGTVTGQGWRYNTVGGWQIQNFEAGDITYTNTSDASITNVSAALDSLFNKTGGNPIVGVSRVELGAVDSIYFELLDGTRFSFTDTSVIQTLATALSTQVIGGHPIETDAETIILSIYDSLMNIQRDTLNKTLLQLALDGTLALNDGGADKIIQILSQDDGNMIAVGTDGGLYYKGSDLCIISVFAHETEGTNLIGNTSNFSPCVEREELYLEVPAVSTLQDTLYITLDTSFMTFPTRAYIKYVATGTIGSAVLKVSTNGAGFHDTSITGSTLESFIVLDSIGDWAMLEIYESQILTFKSSNAGSFTVEPQDIRYGVYPSNPDISYIVTGSDLHTITTAGITYGMPDGIPDTLGLLHTHPTQLFQTLKPSVTLTDCTDSTITVTEATAWAKANNVIVGSLIEFDCGWKGRFESDSTFSWLNKYAQIIPSQSCTETTPYYPFIGQFSGNNNTYTISELSFNGKIYDQGNGVGIVNNGGGSYDLSGPNQGFQLNQQISKDGDYVEFRMDQANNLIGIALTTNQSYNSFENNGNDAKYLLRGTTSSPSLNIIVDGISTGNTFENKVDGMKIRIEQVGKNIEFRQDGNLLYSEAIDEILVEKSICDLAAGIDENAAAIERIQDIAPIIDSKSVWDNPNGSVADENSTDIRYTKGNVGVGITPTEKLHTYASGIVRHYIESASSAAELRFSSNSNSLLSDYSIGTGSIVSNTKEDIYIYDHVGSSTLMEISQSGQLKFNKYISTNFDETAMVSVLGVETNGLVTKKAVADFQDGDAWGVDSENIDIVAFRNGGIGIGVTSLPNQVKMQVKENGSSSSIWRGRLIVGGDNAAFLMGERNNKAWLGAHNGDLTSWKDMYINPDGNFDLFLGNFGPSTVNPIVMIDNSAGNVGIATITPTEKLHVNGNILTTGDFIGTGDKIDFNLIQLNNNSAFPPAPASGYGICVVLGIYYKYDGGAWVAL